MSAKYGLDRFALNAKCEMWKERNGKYGMNLRTPSIADRLIF